MAMRAGPVEWKRCAVLTLLAGLLAACATPNVPSDYHLSDNTEEGLVAVALSFEGTGYWANPMWEYRSLGGGPSGTLMTRMRGVPDNWNFESGGRLAVFALPPGRYEFYQCRFSRPSGGGGMGWTVGGSGGVTMSNPTYSGLNAPTYDRFVANPFSVKFDVLAGKLTYVGELHLRWYYTSEAKGTGEVRVSDHVGRDVPLLQSGLPKLEPGQILSGTHKPSP